MKIQTFTGAAAILLASAAAEDACDNSLVKPYFHEISDSMSACESATGINLQTGSVLALNASEQSEICTECTDMVALVYTFTWYDCEIAIDGADQVLSTYFETLVGTCGNSTSSGSTSNATSSDSTSTSAPSAAASSSSSTSGSVAACDNSLVKPYFHQIGDSMSACESATGINLQTGYVLNLTSAEQSEICSECTDMVDLAYTFTWYDCEIAIDGADQILSTYFETLVGSCGNSTASASGSSTRTTVSEPSSSSTTGTSASSSSSGSSSTPAPTTSSAASSVISSVAAALSIFLFAAML